MPPLSNNVFSWVGEVRPFSPEAPEPVPDRRAAEPLKSKQYAREFNEVKALGAKTGSTRTPDQDALANWIVVNPFGPVNQTFRDLATSHGLSTAEQARLFAMTSLSAADALISCWNNKDFYRVLAAADGHPGGGHGRQPEHGRRSRPGCRCSRRRATPTGRPATTASRRRMMNAGKAFFGTDNVAFDITNANATRSYTRFTGYVHDAIEGRILIGFHFRSADELGALIGEKTAKWVDRHEFRPVH